MFLTCGKQLHAALHGVGHYLGGDVDRDVLHARHSLGGGHQAAAQLGQQALGRVTQLDIKGYIAAMNLHIAQGAGADEILARVGVLHAGERGQKALFGDCHSNNSCGAGSLSKRCSPGV
jgi:hypothetical protein